MNSGNTNPGNAALQGERLGTAILAYRRALALDPNHLRAQRNLRQKGQKGKKKGKKG